MSKFVSVPTEEGNVLVPIEAISCVMKTRPNNSWKTSVLFRPEAVSFKFDGDNLTLHNLSCTVSVEEMLALIREAEKA